MKDSTDRITLASDSPVRAPLMLVRQLVRHSISSETAWKLSEAFVSRVPAAIQRGTERMTDFPIAAHVRAAPVLLVRVPKSASLSLSKQVYGRVTSVPHRTALFYRTSDPSFFAAATSFAVVRNPWDRVMSAYAYLKRNGTPFSRPNPQTRLRMKGIASFDHFVHDYLGPHEGRLHHLDPTVHTQHSYVCDASANVIVSHVFRFERLGEVQCFLSDHGIAPEQHHINRSVRDPSQVSMSATTAAEIARIYATDIAMFGYGTSAPS